jgi:uncharacterized protein (TIGR03000 family)
MYSVLLTTVMSLNATTPEFGRRFGGRDNGCYGCVGCMGCDGGGFLGLRSRYRDTGCYGCAGCYGYSGGCVGSYTVPMTHGAGYPMPLTYADSHPAGGFGVYGAPPPIPYPPPGMYEAIGPQGVPGATGDTPPPPVAGSMVPPDRALFVVTMPADGKLLIDGQPAVTSLTGALRIFQTPPLEAGKEYMYEFAMVLNRDGKRSEVKEPAPRKFRAGQRYNVDFGEPAPQASGTSARIAVRMPTGGALTVEGRPVVLAGGSAFRTPRLEPGRTYYYTMTLAVNRGGRIETLTREVAFRAGEDVAVDFGDVADRTAKR